MSAMTWAWWTLLVVEVMTCAGEPCLEGSPDMSCSAENRQLLAVKQHIGTVKIGNEDSKASEAIVDQHQANGTEASKVSVATADQRQAGLNTPAPTPPLQSIAKTKWTHCHDDASCKYGGTRWREVSTKTGHFRDSCIQAECELDGMTYDPSIHGRYKYCGWRLWFGVYYEFQGLCVR
mmetsp:Transcript_128145/g.255888  ORF Transcript_128145/g.255888 Transcript_128145/m.255888 type:complete len:178 (+) Transcript_128145:25-558(+)